MQKEISPRQWEITEENAERVWAGIIQSVAERADYIQNARPVSPAKYGGPRLTASEFAEQWHMYRHAAATWETVQQYSRIIVDPKGLFTWRGLLPCGLWDTIHLIRQGLPVHICGVAITPSVVRTDPVWENRVTLL